MRAIAAIAVSVFIGLLFASGATQFIASAFDYQAALGEPIARWGNISLYAPWAVFNWTARWAEAYPKAFAVARLLAFLGLLGTLVALAVAFRTQLRVKPFGKQAWGAFDDAREAGLFADAGAVLGKFDGEILAFDGPEHQILIGASRSGKGRGHVVPTLLSWNGSALVLDVKGELDAGDSRYGFPGTSGFRRRLGPVLRFAPTNVASHCFNPLLEVRRGANEVRDIQNIVEIIVGPSDGKAGSEQFWNATAKIVIAGVILHVLYAEPPTRKTLAVVREKLRDLDRTAEEMRLTLHRLAPTTNKPEVHSEVLHAAVSYLAGEERLRSGIKATAESFFGIFADPIVAEKTSTSDFRIGDLMCADQPVTLYLQPPPSDAQRLMPLMRLLISQVARALMEHQTHDGEGREKKHRLMLVLDEFPQLGRLDFFEKMMGAMAGYGLKAYLVCQSLNHITRAYGRDNVILDNCAIVTAFAAADPETAKRIADMAGEVWEIRPQESEQRPKSLLGPRKGQVTYREERRPLMLPADVRGLPRDEQLIFVSGCKPLKAKKIYFDREPIFAQRLRPPAPRAQPIAHVHDWSHVTPLGCLAPERKPVGTAAAARSARAPARPSPALAGQADLFATPAPQPQSPTPTATPPPAPPQSSGAKISELALAGLRPAEPPPPAAPLSPGPTPASEPETTEAPRRRARATGV